MQRCIRSPLFGGFSGPRFCIISLRQFLTSQYILIHQSRLLFQTPPQQCSLWHQSQLTSEAKDMATIQGFNLSGPGIEIPKSETNVHWIILVNPDGGGSSAFFLQPPVPTQTSRIENSRNQTCRRIHQITLWEHDWDLTHSWLKYIEIIYCSANWLQTSVHGGPAVIPGFAMCFWRWKSSSKHADWSRFASSLDVAVSCDILGLSLKYWRFQMLARLAPRSAPHQLNIVVKKQ